MTNIHSICSTNQAFIFKGKRLTGKMAGQSIVQALNTADTPVALGDTTGNDLFKVSQVTVDVQRGAVHGDPPTGSESHGANLVLADPYASIDVRPFAHDSKVMEHIDCRLLQLSGEPV
eukprot:CAMPEP_0184978322 /NCGR_PEP_ID=MMETSP1098-20130426/8853_1 /TAXON_ID=89044 /ORGANISM="Spumella elongata, Strain CCAP 955/1" /LENGTH=117 /DNA_ID=CAMNT_0027501443 /DNA_START=220 /DNA_END=573 /DNA_ORIENTATION=+